jgi:hypothetical protein
MPRSAADVRLLAPIGPPANPVRAGCPTHHLMDRLCRVLFVLGVGYALASCGGDAREQQPGIGSAGAGAGASGVAPSTAGAGSGAGTGLAASGAGAAGRGAAGSGVATAGRTGGAGSAAAGGAAGAIAVAAGTGAAGAGAAGTGAGGASAAAGGAPSPNTGGNAATPPGCGAAMPAANPFNCRFAFGTNDPGGSLAPISELSFVSKWVGYEAEASGALKSCDGCSWLTMNVAPTPLIPVYYAYFIGFFGKANGLPDGNENPNGPNLTTGAAQLIRDHRAGLIEMYASYAKQSAAVWKDKPLIWLLEGDFVQYTAESQNNRLSYAELGQLAQDITCAIKGNMPNALVAINHSTWNADQVTKDFYGALEKVPYDLVWTTGVPNNRGFLEGSANDGSYNKATATYAFIHQLTKRSILVDTSFGLSGMSDSWSGASAADLNARIADGVIAANVTMPASNYVSTVKALLPQLSMTCQ